MTCHPFFSTIQEDITTSPRKYVDGLVRELVLAESSYSVMGQRLASARVVARPVAGNQRRGKTKETQVRTSGPSGDPLVRWPKFSKSLQRRNDKRVSERQ